MKNIILAAIFSLIGLSAFAAPRPPITSYSAVCDPNSPQNCFAPFLLNGSTVTVSATSTSSNTTFTGGPTVIVTNSGSVETYVAFGLTSSVVATTASIPVGPGQTLTLSSGNAQYIAAITATGTATIIATPGVGNPQPGGGGGGGGGGAITGPLGQTTAPLSVATTVNPNDVPTTNISGTVTTGGAFQSISASSTTRHGCFIQNPITATETLFVFFGANASATTSNSVGVAPGAAVTCATGAGQVLSDNISVSAATASHAFMGQVQ